MIARNTLVIGNRRDNKKLHTFHKNYVSVGSNNRIDLSVPEHHSLHCKNVYYA